jgi:hypothetical protein
MIAGMVRVLALTAALLLTASPARADWSYYGVRANTYPAEILAGPFAYASFCYAIMSERFPRTAWRCESMS